MKHIVLAALFTGVLTSLAPAQVRIGDPAPNFEGEFIGSDAKSLADFKGKVVFVDFWRTWCKPCLAQTPHLNELNAKYKAQGLVVLAVTNETPRKLVTETVEKHKMEALIGIIKGDKIDDAYGVNSFPSSFLIDASGHVVWSGHPAQFEESMLKPLLAQTTSVAPLPDTYKDINGWLAKRSYAKAYDAIGKALVKDPAQADLLKTKGELEALVKRRMDDAKKATDDGDFGTAVDLYTEVSEQLEGLPGASEAKAAREAVEKNPAAKDELAAHAQLKKADALAAGGDDDKAILAWKALAKKFPDTKAGKRASNALRQRGM